MGAKQIPQTGAEQGTLMSHIKHGRSQTSRMGRCRTSGRADVAPLPSLFCASGCVRCARRAAEANQCVSATALRAPKTWQCRARRHNATKSSPCPLSSQFSLCPLSPLHFPLLTPDDCLRHLQQAGAVDAVRQLQSNGLGQLDPTTAKFVARLVRKLSSGNSGAGRAAAASPPLQYPGASPPVPDHGGVHTFSV